MIKETLKKYPNILKTLKILSFGFALSMLFGSFSEIAMAQQFSLDLGQEGNLSGRVVQLILLMTVLSLAPSILVTVTSFTRVIIVFSILRTALGTQQTPPNIVIVSLALFLTGFIMMPVFNTAYDNAIAPLINEEITEQEAFDRAVVPFKDFMLRNTRDADLILFMDLKGGEPAATPEETELTVLIPAFMISELKRAFEIGFLLYIPFLVVDMVVASILMSMGMMMLPPVMISLPFKLIFFVLVDGWNLIAGSLVRSFPPPP